VSSAGQFHPGRLWSLGEIMREFKVGNLLQLVATLETLGKDDPRDKDLIRDDAKKSIQDYFPNYEQACRDSGLIASCVSIQKILKWGTAAQARWKDITPFCSELKDRLVDETSVRVFFGLSARESDFFERPRTGWEAAIKRFPDIVEDVEEAGKCYALSRYAASIFHSLQVVEAALIELGDFIGVSDPKSGWTAISNKLTSILKKPYNLQNEFERKNFAFLEQVQGTVEGLKNAWRNKISHVHGRLVLLSADFSPEIAEEILLATRAFSRRLADGLPPKMEAA
jgi:hypothetical protein